MYYNILFYYITYSTNRLQFGLVSRDILQELGYSLIGHVVPVVVPALSIL